MRRWRNYIVLIIGSALVIASLIIYGIRVVRTFIPAGSSPLEINRITQLYGLDRPLVDQFRWFLLTLLPGQVMLGFYATLGMRNRDFQHGLLTKIFIVVMLILNTVTIWNFVVSAQASIAESLVAFFFALTVALLALVNFMILLVVWNGFRWSVWVFGILSFLICTLKFVGGIPIVPVVFEFSSVFILIYLLRTSWAEME